MRRVKTNVKRSGLLYVVMVLLMAGLVWIACQPKRAPIPATSTAAQFPEARLRPVAHPDWSYNQSIYEVNLRQYSPGGTFSEFEGHLPRLEDLGVGILWFMPINPIGEENRKGSLGSYYSVRDYYGVNPEFGTLEDFRRLVDEIHDMGMHVIIDWVANHAAWDNLLTKEHPEWFIRDVHGDFVPPVDDWSDVIDLNYSDPGLWRYMIDAMKFWVRDADVDGFRCDVAGMVPLEFWNVARAELDSIKPVFMLAEWEAPEAHDFAFDMTYSWNLYHLMNKIAKQVVPASAIGVYLERERDTYPRDAYRMLFTSNHDENSWNGTAFERLGDAAPTLAVLCATLEGMPLVYSGQEAGLSRRLEFFEKDLIPWQDHPMGEIYSVLLNLKKDNRALWNGKMGGEPQWIHTSDDNAVFAFLREKDGDRVLVILNLTPEEQMVSVKDELGAGDYKEAFSGETVTVYPEVGIGLLPWGYVVLAASGHGKGLLTPPFIRDDTNGR